MLLQTIAVSGLLIGTASSLTARAAAPAMTAMATHLHDPAARDTHFGGNWAKYLVDLHDTKAAFDFCGGMMFREP